MTIKLSTGTRNGLAGTSGYGALFANGIIYIYSGPQPLTADAAPTGTLLGIVTKDGGAFTPGSPTNGLTFAAVADGAITKSTDNWKFTGLAAGTAGWFRQVGNAADSLAASTTAVRMDGSVGTNGADLNLSNLSVAVGSPNTIDVFRFTIPAQ